MPIDPDDPPVWLRKLHVSAAQISPSDYPATPEEGILEVCRLSDAALALSKTFSESRSPEDVILLMLAEGRPGDFDDVMTIVDNAQLASISTISGPEQIILDCRASCTTC